MERRSFLQAILGLGIAASAGIMSVCTKRSNADDSKKVELYYEENLGFAVLDNRDILKGSFELDQSEMLLDPPSVTTLEHKKNLEENRYYKPRWNINGNWNKAESRQALISHLSGSNHGHKRSYLNTLSTDELQKLHDKDHDSRRQPTTRRWLFRR